ncbi:hypothetical protein CSKR_110761 [Clonorchis sinensis]|uniref:Uncharacterized protein n=1 Tax=Clonorchis sinensis TaxID=79923 RepID=A0A419Q1X7_CLOSI|nr:hypothetical protein CSKR_110761 [Clonorchis sinensis]
MFSGNRMCCTRPPHAPVATIFEISRHMYIHNALLIRLLRILRQPTSGFTLLLRVHEAGAVPEFPSVTCLETSQTGDSAGFQNIRLTETRGLRLPDEPQEGRNRSWAVEEFSTILCFSNLMSSALRINSDVVS